MTTRIIDSFIPSKNRFAKEEAESKIGKLIQTTTEWAGVPAGSTGKVTAADFMGDGWDVVIEWDVDAGFGSALADWFPKDDYERHIKELD